MKMRHAFTLLEMILAMALSSVIIVGLLQLQRSLTNNFSVAQNLMTIDRKVSLLFNQMEHDFTSAYIPFLEREKKSEKENVEAEKKAKDQRKTFFVGAFKDIVGSVSKIDGKRVELLAYASFICTNPFQVIDEHRQRLVRIVYELVVDKAKSTFDEPVYQLVRKETQDLGNVRAWVSEFESPAQKKNIRTHIVADNIKGMFIEYETELERPGAKSEEKKILLTWRWGDRDETKAVVPQKVNIWLEMWDDRRTRSFRYHTSFPILSYPTRELTKAKQPATGGKESKEPAATKKVVAKSKKP